MDAKRKHLFWSIILLAVILLLGGVGAEFALRLKNSSMTNYNIEMWRYAKLLKVPSGDPILGHEHRKPSEAVLQSVDIRINSKGLRGPELDGKPHDRRILFLGSSITLGWGVEEQDTMTSLVQDRLRAAGIDAVVYNAGIGNYNTVRYVQRFFTHLKDLNPTDIVVNYFVNDAEELPPGGGNWLLRNSQLALTCWALLQNVCSSDGLEGLVEHYKAVYAPDAPGFLAMQASLKQLADYAEEHGIRLYVLFTPDIHQLQDYKLGFVHEKVEAIAVADGYTVIDTLREFKKRPASEFWAMPGDPHPNKLGHLIMAEAIWPALAAGQP